MECRVECVEEYVSSGRYTDDVFVGCEIEVEAQDGSSWFSGRDQRTSTLSPDTLSILSMDGLEGTFWKGNMLQTTDLKT